MFSSISDAELVTGMLPVTDNTDVTVTDTTENKEESQILTPPLP